jgi:hypothetical protein
MKRLDIFRELRNHPFYGRDFKRLSIMDINSCEMFARQYENLNHIEFEYQVQRWLIDCPERRGKTYPIMSDLLLAANTEHARIHLPRRDRR